MADTTPTDIAKLADGLSKAQREAIRALATEDWRTWPEGRLGCMMDGLGKSGLAPLRDVGLAKKGPPWRLTPLGLAVRTHLTGDKR